MHVVWTGDSVVGSCAPIHLFRFLACSVGAHCRRPRSGVGVVRRTVVGLPLLGKMRYSSTGRHGDELNTGCGAAW